MKTNYSPKDNRHCSQQVCIDCFVQSGCLHMGHAFDIPDTWDLQQADDLLFKRKTKPADYILKAGKTIHVTYSAVHS